MRIFLSGALLALLVSAVYSQNWNCPSGQQQGFTQNNCVNCVPGTWSAGGFNAACASCGNGRSTVGAGSDSVNDCKLQCQVGSFYDVNRNVCEQCSQGTYSGNSIDPTTQALITACTSCFSSLPYTGRTGATSSGECTTAPVSCNPGSFYSTSQNSCQQCPAGFYQDVSGQITCKRCSGNQQSPVGSTSAAQCGTTGSCQAGWYRSQQSAQCTQCAAGSYTNAPNQASSCTLCAIGQYNPNIGQIQCFTCTQGTTTQQQGSTSSLQCISVQQTCQPGQYRVGQGCQSCNPGSYSSSVNAFQCTSCAPGTYQSSPGTTSCISCGGQGYTSPSGATSATQCTLTTCQLGYYRPSGNQCFPCSPGFYSNGGATTTCTLCGIGQYQPSQGQGSCISCGNQQTTNQQGSTSATQCITLLPTCNAGSYVNTQSRTCQLCSRGTYQPTSGSQTFCQSCIQPRTTTREGAVSVTECVNSCPAGNYLVGQTCTPCQANTYNPTAGAISCLNCPGNQVTRVVGASSSSQCVVRCLPGHYLSNNVCLRCPKGQYQPQGEQTQCVSCTGQWTTRQDGATSQSQCVPSCGPGHYLLSVSCLQCPLNTYNDQSEQTFCPICPQNLATRTMGASSIVECVYLCPAGNYQLQDSASCRPCPEGQYQDQRGQPQCIQCTTNEKTYVSGASNVEQCLPICQPGYQMVSGQCIECSLGYYQSQSGETSCVACSNQHSTLQVASTSANDCVEVCRPGSRLDLVTNTCNECSIGYYQDQAGKTSCIRCRYQRTTRSEGSASAADCMEMCTEGYRWDRTSEECIPCEVGYYNNEPGEIRCKPCPTSRSTTDEGATSRDQCYDICTMGYYFDHASKRCSLCLRGYYKPSSSFDQCTRCSSGKTTLFEGATQDSECYTICPAGQFLSAGICQHCQQGYYNPSTGAQTCKPCRGGYTTLQAGAINEDECILQCPSGYEKDMDTLNCMPCKRGYYKTSLSTAMCTRCPSQYITAGEGSTFDTDCNVGNCKPGYYIVGSNCRECERGQYQPDKWMTSCLRCRSSFTTSNTGSVSESECIFTCGAGYYAESGNCNACPVGMYKPNTGVEICKSCPSGYSTDNIGSTNRTQCNVPVCGYGTFRNTASQQCELCGEGQYQDEQNSISCKNCPSGTTTYADSQGFFGAKSASNCFSTDECTSGRHNCHQYALCRNTNNGYSCTCRPGYEGDGIDYCEHVCDLGNYCRNGGLCSPTSSGGRCTCTEGYTGSRCETKMTDENLALILGSVFGALGFLLLVGLIAGCSYFLCCRDGGSSNVVVRSAQAPSTVVVPQQESSVRVVERVEAPTYISGYPSTTAGYSTSYNTGYSTGAEIIKPW